MISFFVEVVKAGNLFIWLSNIVNYTWQFITSKLFGIFLILLKICAPSPVILAKFTDILEKCILLSLLPSYGTAHTQLRLNPTPCSGTYATDSVAVGSGASFGGKGWQMPNEVMF